MPEQTLPLRIAVVAGEASGDVLAAGMVRELRQRYPEAIIEGIGGRHMQAEGFDSLFDMETLSVMGLVEVLGRLRQIVQLKRKLLSYFEANPPDVYVGVDAPDFNLRIEKELKQRGIPTVHYVSPTVWAWREKRIHKIGRATSLVMGIFPFEQQIYDKYGLPFQFVGHSLADDIPIQPDKIGARRLLDVDQNTSILGVLPGSRKREITTLLPVFLKTMQSILDKKPNVHFLIPAANQYRFEEIQAMLNDQNLCGEALKQHIKLVDGKSREVMIASDALLLASGTASLEGMLCKRPMVVGYKMSALTNIIMRRLYKPAYFALPNILANRLLVPELLQEDVNPKTLSELLLPWLEHPPEGLIGQFIELHEKLKCDADARAAEAVLSVIKREIS